MISFDSLYNLGILYKLLFSYNSPNFNMLFDSFTKSNCSSNRFKSLDKSNYFDNDGDHSDELETSLILYLRPELVEKKIHWGECKQNKINVKSLR